MRALVFESVGRVAAATVPDPAIEDPRDLLVKVEVAGLCGSDLHPYEGRERGLDPGTVMGHEFVGRVVERGPEARLFRTGDLVVGSFTTCCGTCFYCRRGLPARCERGELFGWVEGGRGLQGAQAEYVRVPLADATLVAVPEGCPAEAALFTGDVLATGAFAAEQARIGGGETVAVLGCGAVGLCALLAAREAGAERLFAVDRLADRLKLAERFGAEPLSLDAGDPLAAVRGATAGRGADAVLECVGSPEATRLAVDLVRPGGVVAAVGVHTESAFAFAPGEAYDKNLTYVAGRCPARRFMEPLLAGLARGRWPVTELISHRLPLEGGPEAYRIFAERRAGCTKILFRPGGSSAGSGER